MIEKVRMAYVAEYGYSSGALSFPRLYSKELLDQAGTHLMRAATAVADGPQIYQQRVAFIQAGATFTSLLIANINDMRSYWKNKDEDIGTRVVNRWETMEELCLQNPYAINWGPVRPSTPRMIGLHPDYPNPKLKPGDLDDLDQN